MGWWKADPVPEASAPIKIPAPNSPPPHAAPDGQTGTPGIQDWQAQLLQLEQQNKKHLALAKQEATGRDNTPVSVAHRPHPVPTPQIASETGSSCPVDPQTRSIWLKQAQAQARSAPPEPTPPPQQASTPFSTSTFTTAASKQCSSDRISQSPTQPPPASSLLSSKPLSQARQVSTIPRAHSSTSTDTTTPPIPANSETETGPHSSGNWIYPSESQFFNAVMRKQTLTSSTPTELASSVSSIIPIHNAVNERAWHLIKQWEGDSSKSCGGPKLLSFQGLGAGALSPKARWNSFWGYTEPFDRHDWVVQRCDGREVEYLIDFYQGKEEPGMKQGTLNFFLDVRPKVNTWEGCRMRAEKILGMR